ncbi:MAG TPA: hemolysin III family protein [Acidobacteriota bacterium]|nr:hemolysin III family protein [Acidobacteriota bacterium]HNB72362.1 hemolysin III family protein [Acidobacteriota bacterium]HND20437.1 hemolysin III family protein [Acidobacteriota bacterium]HNG95479.1 hemolysin III family protein [Acidobacteriota bacterium]HNJ41153.1 hemolysin III family protein [Acidobacteriota bacterium]
MTEQSHDHHPYTPAEELANWLSHGAGFVGSLIALPILVASALGQSNLQIVAVSVFAASMMLLYLASTIYHVLPPSKHKHLFRIVDHAAIYVLIAGTYTPFTLGVLRGAWGWTLFGIVWSMAIAGIVFKALGGIRFDKLSTALYLAMGWLVVIAIKPLITLVPMAGLVWLFVGGIFYTGGVAFYAATRLKYHHFLWHLCVLAGTFCHFFAVLWYSQG